MNAENIVIASQEILVDSELNMDFITSNLDELNLSEVNSSNDELSEDEPFEEELSEEESYEKENESVENLVDNKNEIVVMMNLNHTKKPAIKRDIFRVNGSFESIFEELECKPILKNWTESLSIQIDNSNYYRKSKKMKYFRIYSKSLEKYTELMLMSNYNIRNKNGYCDILTSDRKKIIYKDVDSNCIEFFSGSHYQIGNQDIIEISPKVKFITRNNNRVTIIIDETVVNDNIDYNKIKILDLEKNYAYFDPFMCYIVKDIDVPKSFKYYKLYTVECVNGKNRFDEISKTSWSFKNTIEGICLINGLGNNPSHPKYTYNNDTKLWSRVNGIGSMLVVRIISDKKCSTFTYRDEVHYGLGKSELLELYGENLNNLYNVFIFTKSSNIRFYDEKMKKVILIVYGDIIPKTLPDTPSDVFNMYKSLMFEKFVLDVSEYLKNPNPQNIDAKNIVSMYENFSTKSSIELKIIYDFHINEYTLNMYKDYISKNNSDPINIVEIYFMIIQNDYISRISNCYPQNEESQLSEEFFVKHMINVVFKRDHINNSDNPRYIVDEFLKIKRIHWEKELNNLLSNNIVVNKDSTKTTKVCNFPYFYRNIAKFCHKNNISPKYGIRRYVESIRNELIYRAESFFKNMKYKNQDICSEIEKQKTFLKKYNQYKELVEGKSDIIFEIKNLAHLLYLIHRDPLNLILLSNFSKIVHDVILNANENENENKIIGIYTEKLLKDNDITKYSNKAHNFFENKISTLDVWRKYFGDDFINHPDFRIIIDCINYEISIDKENMDSYESLLKDIEGNKLEDDLFMLNKYGPVVFNHNIYKGLVKMNNIRKEYQSKVDKYKLKQTEYQNNILSYVDNFNYVLRDAKIYINRHDFSIKITKCMEETDSINKEIKNNIFYILKDFKYLGESNITFEYDYEISPGVKSKSMNYGSYWTNGDFIICLSSISEKKDTVNFPIPGLQPIFGIHQSVFKNNQIKVDLRKNTRYAPYNKSFRK